MALDIQALRTERDRLREGLRELEAEQRRLEADIKALRQKEIQTKREIEALTTLIDLNDDRDGPDERAKKAEPRGGEAVKGEA